MVDYHTHGHAADTNSSNKLPLTGNESISKCNCMVLNNLNYCLMQRDHLEGSYKTFYCPHNQLVCMRTCTTHHIILFHYTGIFQM